MFLYDFIYSLLLISSFATLNPILYEMCEELSWKAFQSKKISVHFGEDGLLVIFLGNCGVMSVYPPVKIN